MQSDWKFGNGDRPCDHSGLYLSHSVNEEEMTMRVSTSVCRRAKRGLRAAMLVSLVAVMLVLNVADAKEPGQAVCRPIQDFLDGQGQSTSWIPPIPDQFGSGDSGARFQRAGHIENCESAMRLKT